MANFIAQVWILNSAAVPDTFHAVNMIVAFIGFLIITYVIEDKEFRFRPKISRISQAKLLKIIFRFYCYVAGVSGVIGTGNRILDVAYHYQGLNGSKGINKCSGRHRYDKHIRLINRPPSAN